MHRPLRQASLRPRAVRATLCALGAAALALSLTACGGSMNPFDDHEEKASYQDGAAAKSARKSMPRWLPDDASGIKYVMSTTGDDRIITFKTPDGKFPAQCTKGDPQGKPRLKADWFPSDLAAKADTNCGAWSGATVDGVLYAWQDNDVAMKAKG
ncbi:hypothetical protein AB0B50_06940 [Streptomyces sp. NPDC041068]|uniref:hypothetical protein n=1 Tax=Streptomyces sp. NPDC041068 TaxID=3155130 RepID=UPI0033D3C77D